MSQKIKLREEKIQTGQKKAVNFDVPKYKEWRTMDKKIKIENYHG